MLKVQLLKIIFLNLLFFIQVYAVNSQMENFRIFNDPRQNPKDRYEAITEYRGKMIQCKSYYYDPEFWLRMGCLENYVLNGKTQKLDVSFLKNFLTDEAFVVRSFILKILIELQIKNLEETLWFVVEDPRNYRKSLPLENVRLAMVHLPKTPINSQRAKSLQKTYPGLGKLESFRHLL